jgi:tubulin polyglutamylase TTLL1
LVAAVITYAVLHTTYIEHLHMLDDKEMQSILPYIHSIVIRHTNYTQFRTRYNETPLNFIEDPSYCLNSDKYKLLHPSVILEDRYVVRDLEKNNLQREIIKKNMFDAVQGLRVNQSK